MNNYHFLICTFISQVFGTLPPSVVRTEFGLGPHDEHDFCLHKYYSLELSRGKYKCITGRGRSTPAYVHTWTQEREYLRKINALQLISVPPTPRLRTPNPVLGDWLRLLNWILKGGVGFGDSIPISLELLYLWSHLLFLTMHCLYLAINNWHSKSPL